MAHILYICKGEHEGLGCQFCDGELSSCVTCGAFEGAWPDDCPGEQMGDYVSNAVYNGTLNFRDGEWRSECCQAMRHIHDLTNYMAEAGYTFIDGRWEK